MTMRWHCWGRPVLRQDQSDRGRAGSHGVAIASRSVTPRRRSIRWNGCNLHLALSAIDRLIAMLPDRDMAPVEAADFNRQTLAEAERVCVTCWRCIIARTARPEPMWRAVASAAPPNSMAHTLRQFEERGRLPFYEEETFHATAGRR